MLVEVVIWFNGIPTLHDWVQSAGLQNTQTASLQRGTTPPTSVLDLTLITLMMRLQ